MDRQLLILLFDNDELVDQYMEFASQELGRIRINSIVEKIKKSLQQITPYLNDIKDKVEAQAHKTKEEVELKVKENPWISFGIVGLIAFFIGWLVGHRTNHRD